jgi:hypothetical protein
MKKERELADARLDRLPGTQERNGGQERRQDDEQQADTVDADVIRNPEVGQPRVLLDELVLGRRGVEPHPHGDAENERDERRDERQMPDHAVAPAAQQQPGDAAGERYDHEEGQERQRHGQR